MYESEEEEVDEGPQPTNEQLAEFTKGFSFFDQAQLETITSRELASILRKMGITPTEAEITDMINEVDADGNGTVEIDEFIEMMMNKFDDDPGNVDELKQTFDVFDTDGDGYITARELHTVLLGLGQHKLTFEQVVAMIASIDTDGDGKVDFDEFSAMVNDVAIEDKPEGSLDGNKSGSRPATGKPGSRPATGKPESRPQTKNETIEETKSESKSPIKSESRPETKEGSRPETKEGSRPETKEGSRPETKEGSRPETKEGSRPETKEGSRPETKEGSRPETKEGSRPETKEGSRPETKEGSRPETKNES